jgi:thiamine pyrophosphate-dependent acetolactate synthase large subunit-like protein
MGFAPLTGPEVRAATFPSHAWPPVIRATASRHHPGPCVMRIPHPRRRASGPLRRRWFSFPASLGAKFAAPHRPVVNFNGDGGFLFNAQLETAVRYGLRVVTVIMNNSCWGSLKA